MSPRTPVLIDSTCGFPRVSGDEPCREFFNDLSYRFSPRERG